MTHSNDFVSNHRALLDVFLIATTDTAGSKRDALINRMLSIGKGVSASGNPAAIIAYERYQRLLCLRLSDPGLEKVLKLPEGTSNKGDEAIDLISKAFRDQANKALDALGRYELLRPLERTTSSGISVVTCAMNRTENLLKALPSWLRNEQVSEVIIVDWSSKKSVRESLELSGVVDPRVRIIRVDGEQRWILSYAFNAGFRASTFNTILKVDADIVLSDDFFRQNELGAGEFIAGNWRTAAEGQAFVNGFFFTSRQSLVDVGGFNEFITTYGWDDDDIYTRLEQAGYSRKDVATDTIHHLPHSDFERTGQQGTDLLITARDGILGGTDFLIHRNRHLADIMPQWDSSFRALPLHITKRTPLDLTLQRSGLHPHVVSAELFEKAGALARTDLVSWRFGPRVKELTPDVLDRLLDRQLCNLSRIDVEVALISPSYLPLENCHYLVLQVDPKIFKTNDKKTKNEFENGFEAILRLAHHWGLTPVLWMEVTTLPKEAPACLSPLPLIPSWYQLGDVETIDIDELAARSPNANRMLTVTPKELRYGWPTTFGIGHLRKKFYIDAQHGLGNRLRAIGSAASIAAATNRDLVIVWEPDHHCNCQFSDLFDYAGEVVQRAFIDDAKNQGCEVYNYMPIEAGAEKDQIINHDSGEHIYARSAFTLKNTHSTWDAENRFLKSLAPVDAVRELVNSVSHPFDVAAHVRMEAGVGKDHNSYDQQGNWRQEDHELIHHWRDKSHFSYFMRRIDSLIAGGGVEKIFVATDLPETYEIFKKYYNDRLVWLPRKSFDRSSEQLRYALADAILLSSAPLILGSTWSSFSELAMRIAPKESKIEMSGKDF